MSNYDDPYITYVDDESREHCEAFSSSNSFPQIIQGCLAAMALASLWWKRKSERPKRHIKTWTLDVAKQGGGAVYAHFLNIIVASFLVSNEDDEMDDACAWYAMAFIIDTTFGLVLSVVFLKILVLFARRFDWERLKDSGIYLEDDVSRFRCCTNCWFNKTWRFQFYSWLFILTWVKLIIAVVMVITSSGLSRIGSWLFFPLQGSPKLELIFVMILFPGFFNILYFWIIDNYLKVSGSHPPTCTFNSELKLFHSIRFRSTQNNSNNNEINNNWSEYRRANDDGSPSPGSQPLSLPSNFDESLLPSGVAQSDVVPHHVNIRSGANVNTDDIEMKEPSWITRNQVVVKKHNKPDENVVVEI